LAAVAGLDERRLVVRMTEGSEDSVDAVAGVIEDVLDPQARSRCNR
jgi:hypothetical protein